MLQPVDADFTLVFQLADSSDTPVVPDAAPTWRIYDGEGGLVGDGTATPFLSGTIDSVSLAATAQITSVAHQLRGTVRVTISGVAGPTAVNATTTATVVSANAFTVPIDTSAADPYGGGGQWQAAGLYRIDIGSAVRGQLEPGHVYTVLADYAVSSARKVHQLEPLEAT